MTEQRRQSPWESDQRHRSPWEAADCPDCGRGLFVDEHSSGSGYVCHDCEIRFADRRARGGR